MKIRKRDGRIQEFDSGKVNHAVTLACYACGWDALSSCNTAKRVAQSIEDKARNWQSPIDIEAIQDAVEDTLMQKESTRDVAKAYIKYRNKRAEIRNLGKMEIEQTFSDYLGKGDWLVKENANQDFSLQGLNNYVVSKATKKFWLNELYSEEIRTAHEKGLIHIHDLNLLSVYCVGWDLKDLLIRGFRGAKGNTSSKPANHFRSALGQLVNFMYTLQGEASGAQAVSSFDTLLSPFVRHDGLTYEQVKSELQDFIFNMNVATRVGGQTPFTNITMDLVCHPMLKDEPVIIGGVPQNTTYKEYQHEMDMINRAFAEVMCEGDADGRVFTFPIPTYNITKDFDWDNPNLDAVWRMTGKYGIPYFSNFVNSDLKPEDARSMCCRLKLDVTELQKRGGGLFGANPLTGSIGVVTMNLPRIAFLSQDEEEFFKLLAHAMDLGKDSLCAKRKVLERETVKGLYPYSSFYLSDVFARHKKYWANHFSTIGLVGMNEACLNFMNKDITRVEGEAFARKVLKFMLDRLRQYQDETGDFFNLEATPAEGTSFRLALLDRKEFGDKIIQQGTPEVPYYTNSSQLPVGYTDDIFEALSKQERLQTMYTGGTVLHGFLGEAVSSVEAVKSLIRTATSSFRVPYITLTPTFSVCPNHGYLSGEHETCPDCGEECDVYSRVVGYIRPVRRWNDGKQAEFADRKVFKLNA